MRIALKILNLLLVLLNVKQFENYLRFTSNGWKFKWAKSNRNNLNNDRNFRIDSVISWIFHSIIRTEFGNFLFLSSRSSSLFCRLYHYIIPLIFILCTYLFNFRYCCRRRQRCCCWWFRCYCYEYIPFAFHKAINISSSLCAPLFFCKFTVTNSLDLFSWWKYTKSD